MRVDLCICAELTPIESNTRFVVVMHHDEWNKTTNSAVLVKRLLPKTEIRVRRRYDPPIEVPGIGDSPVLFPSADADVVSTNVDRLIVPDGSWRQSKRMLRKEPIFAGRRHVKLPPGPPSEFHVRRQHRPENVSTLEAIARVLEIQGEPEAAHHLLEGLRCMVRKVLWSRSGH